VLPRHGRRARTVKRDGVPTCPSDAHRPHLHQVTGRQTAGSRSGGHHRGDPTSRGCRTRNSSVRASPRLRFTLRATATSVASSPPSHPRRLAGFP
jgi:hypothetical protein